MLELLVLWVVCSFLCVECVVWIRKVWNAY